jgi:hypothetical protein
MLKQQASRVWFAISFFAVSEYVMDKFVSVGADISVFPYFK